MGHANFRFNFEEKIMKQLVFLICIICLIPCASLAKKTDKGQGNGPAPNNSAYEHASDNAKFKRSDNLQRGQGKYDDEDDDEINTLDEKSGSSKEHKHNKNKHSENKSKGEHDKVNTDDGKRKLKKSDGEKGDNKSDESNENKEGDPDKEKLKISE